ncbi:MAG TPA: hypothetical protein VHH09_00980 [Acidimicrobiales bacterium]|nr:hypothetical protein [Acidimicrobiales bacterium]
MVTVAAGSLALSGPSSADVVATRGEAYGYFASVSLFGGPAMIRGPQPIVTLPPTGSAMPLTANQATGLVQYGPAIIFSSGPITVSTQGTLGPGGSVTSSTDIQTINTSESEIFTADRLQSSCTASETGVSGSTTVTNGTIILQDPDPDVSGEPGEQIVSIPTNPAPNTTYNGTVANVNDNFQAIFNEQIVNPDGSITVYAYHLRLLGPTAVGDLFVGKSECGVTAVTVTTTSTSTSTSTTVAPTTTSTSTTSTSTTVAPTSTTTTVVGPTTTVCRPGWGFGDRNHCHSGPPGQLRRNVANVDDGNGSGGLLVLLAVAFGLLAIARPRRTT